MRVGGIVSLKPHRQVAEKVGVDAESSCGLWRTRAPSLASTASLWSSSGESACSSDTEHSAAFSQPRAETPSVAGAATPSVAEIAEQLSGKDRFADPSQVLLFYDWDDTLFPTTDIFDRWGVPRHPKSWTSEMLDTLPADLREQLRIFGDALARFLCAACSRSESVVIVTNAGDGWVLHCIKAFVPQLLPLFSEVPWGLRVVYARAVYRQKKRRPVLVAPEEQGVSHSADEQEEELTASKQAAMWREAHRFYDKRREAHSWANILSVGDMRYERDALHNVDLMREGPPDECLRIKTHTVLPDRTISAMTWDLEAHRLLLPALVRHDGSFDLQDDELQQTFAAAGDALDIPELNDVPMPWRGSPQEDSASALDLCASRASLRQCGRAIRKRLQVLGA